MDATLITNLAPIVMVKVSVIAQPQMTWIHFQHQKNLYLFHRRLQKIKYNYLLVFGVVGVVVIGYTGKLTSVRRRVLWEWKTKTKNDISGLNMYI